MRVPLRTTPVRHIEHDQLGTPATVDLDIAALKAELERVVEGEVRFDGGSRGIYAQDASNYRMPPIGVVVPNSVADVEATLAVARRLGAPVISRGGGTSIPGQGINSALMIDFSKYLNRVVEVDAENRVGVVEPGCILDDLRDAAKPHGLTFGPDPATHDRCTLGGMIGNNSCGIHSVMAGRTADNIEELEVLLYDGTRMRLGRTSDQELHSLISEGGRKGEIYAALVGLRDKYADLIRDRYPKIPRRVSGYNLDELLPENGFNVARALVGSEGTCVTVLKAWCKLVANPAFRSVVLLGFPGVGEAGDFVPEALAFKPIGCEGMDDKFFEAMRKKKMQVEHRELLPEGKAWLLVEFGGATQEEANDRGQEMISGLRQELPHRLLDKPELQTAIWHLREAGLGATAHVPGEKENHEGWEDTAVHPSQVGAYLRDYQALMEKYNYHGSLYGHFGDGCVHIRLDFDLESKQGIENYRHFVEEGADLVHRYNGSLSGEHGDGQAKGELLERMYGPELIQAFTEFKRIWDPDWKMNPGKMIAPYRLDENLTLGADFQMPQIQSTFAYPNDHDNFAFATRRCVGAGVCRRTHGGTMCPSFMATREEKHSTRGRSRILFEMIEGETVKAGWASEEVKDALDLCLSCKGCKGDCPVQVDVATYKAEFLSHYYQRRARPRQAYFFGFIQVWSRFAALAPGFLNLISHAPGLAKVAKSMAGIAPGRQIPRFAPYTFRSWWNSRPAKNLGKPRVILWADTFNNHFHPTTAQAAVEVLEHAGFQVSVPRQHLCCGRPLYDYGFLGQAKAYLRTVLDALRDEVRLGTKIVVLEPSCCSVFRDELLNLFPNDPDAERLSKLVVLLSEFLEEAGYQPPKLKRRAMLHGHCHHKSIMRMKAEKSVLQRMDLEIEEPDTGCCGMAGAFGFEPGDHYEVSIRCGERVLLPEVRNASIDTLIVADGFSCREQVEQTTDRVPLHLAQVIQMAIREGENGPTGVPEKKYVTPPRSLKEDVKTAVIIGVCVYGAFKLASWALGGGRGRHRH